MIDETGIENKSFPLTFFWLQLGGFWLPTTVKKRWLHVGYCLYEIFSIFSISVVIIGSLLYVVLVKDTFFFPFIENWPLTAVCIHIMARSLNVIRKRPRILRLLRTQFVVERWTNLRDAEEIRLIKISKASEYNLLLYWGLLVIVNDTLNALNPLMTSNPDVYMMYRSWLPCDINVPSCHWTFWLYQVLCYAFASIGQISCDCLVLNFIDRLCAHFRILQHRLTLLPHLVSTGVLSTAEKERIYVNECILAHQNIYSTIDEISEMFNVTTFIYFTFNFSILCTTIFYLSKQPLISSDFVAATFFLFCMLMQSLINCWYGYKLTLVGSEITYTIFSMDWYKLRKDTRNKLRFIMLSGSKNISLFNNFVVELSPEMFLKMLKISYSAFNLLKTQN